MWRVNGGVDRVLRPSLDKTVCDCGSSRDDISPKSAWPLTDKDTVPGKRPDQCQETQ